MASILENVHIYGVLIIASVLAEQKLIDLTHDLDRDAIFWLGNPRLNLTSLQKGMYQGFWLEYNRFSAGEHGGTHMDAPIHFSQDNWHLDEIPLERFIGPGVVIDLSERAREDPDTQLLVSDLVDWEEKYGKIPSNAFILLNSGWDKNWPDYARVFGSRQLNDSSTFHFPSFSVESARWLVENRPYITAIGLDTPSFDSNHQKFPVHLIVLPRRILGLENVANLGKVPASGATIYAMPMKLKGGSGGPMRMFAVVGDGACAQTSSKLTVFFVISLVASLLSSA